MSTDKKEWQKVTLGEREFTFDMLPADRAVMLNMQVVDAFGGLVVTYFSAAERVTADGDPKNISFGTFAPDLLAAMPSVKPEKSKAIFDVMLPTCFVRDTTNPQDNGHRCSYNDFNGRVKELYKVMFYTIRYNFADFFGASLLNGPQVQGARDV